MQDGVSEPVLARTQRLFGLKREQTVPIAALANQEAEKRPRVAGGEVDEEEETKSYTVVHVAIVTDILRHYGSLLTADERRVLSAFLGLADATQKVFVRLLARKYRLFRCGHLDYAQTEAALLELQRCGFAHLVNGPLQFAGNKHRALAFLRLARVGELRTVAAAIALVERNKLPRDALLERLAQACCEEKTAGNVRSQSTLSFAASSAATAAKKNAQGIENALIKVLRGASSSSGLLSSSSSSTQSSLLSMWGKKKPAEEQTQAAPSDAADEDKAAKSSVAPKFILEHGFAVVLSHAVCALFDRVESLYFLDMSDVKSLIMAKRDQLVYPTYACNRHGVPFATRQQMLEYSGASHLLHLFLLRSDQLPDPNNAWSSVSSDDVPIPGRPLMPPELPEDFCKTLLLQTFLVMHEEGCFDLALDPLAGQSEFEALGSQMAREGKQLNERGALDLNALVASLTDSDAAPLSIFEPKSLAVEKEGKEEVLSGIASSSQLSQQQMLYMRRFRREYVLLYILRFGVDYLEKQKDYATAIFVLRLLLSLESHVRPHAQRKMGWFWLRLSLDCVHLLKNKRVAHAVAVLSLERGKEELSLAGTIKMQQRLLMLAKGLGLDDVPEFPLLAELKSIVHETISGSLLRREAGRKSLFEGVDGEPCSVEELVMQHYAEIGGWSGVHCEGSIWRSLVVLLLWDIVYDSSIPFVFQQPCQTVPMDFYSPFFALNRQTSLEVFVAGITSGAIDVRQVLRANYEAHFNCLSPVNWSYPVEHFCSVVDGLSREALTQLIMYAANDFRLFGKGMPDLCLWRERGAPRLLLSEVKGPRDRLSPEQEAHLIRLNQIGVTAIVTHVKESGVGEKVKSDDEEEEGDEKKDDE